MDETENFSVVLGRSSTFATFLSSVAESKGISTRTEEQQKLVDGMVEFVESLGEWKVFATHTYRFNASLAAAGRIYRKFMVQSLPTISFFYAVESHPGGHGGHVHALWDSDQAPRIATHREWLKRYGRNRIEPVRGRRDVVTYCSKVCYLLKDGRCWWDYRLSRSRFSAVRRDEIFSPLQNLREKNFGLAHGSTPGLFQQPVAPGRSRRDREQSA